MKTTMMNRIFTRRGLAVLVSLVIVFSIITASFSALSASGDTTQYFLPETVVYTAFASIISSNGNGNLRLGAEVRNQGVPVTNTEDFDFQWQFSVGSNSNFSDISGAINAQLTLTNATTEGFYRCVVTYENKSNIDIQADIITPETNPFTSNSVRVTFDPNTTPYTAVIEDFNTLSIGRVSLRAAILNRNGQPVGNPEDFRYEWRFTEMQVLKEGGEDIITWLPERIVKQESPDPTYAQPPNEVPTSGRYQCFVRYIGDGEPWQNQVIFYTGDANCMVTVITTAASTTMSTPNRALQNVQPSNFNTNFAGVSVRVVNGALAFYINNGFNSTRWVYYNFQLYSVVDGQRAGAPLVATGRFLENGNGVDPITFEVVLTGRDTFELVYEIRRNNGVSATSNGTGTAQNGQDYYTQGRFNFSVTGTTETPAIIGFETTDDENIDIDVGVTINGGAGASLRVDYPTYPANTTGANGDITVVYQHPAHSVTYNSNGGTGLMTQDIIRRNSNYAIKANSFTREDYGFAGWNTAADGSGTAFAATIPDITENITLFAQWSQNLFTVTFDPNGGEVSPTSALTEVDGKLSSLPIPWRDGANFAGWFRIAVDGGAQVTSDTVFMGNATVFAHWTHDIEYYANGGTGIIEDDIVQSGANYIVKEDEFIRQSFIFMGWSLNEDGSGTRYFAGSTIPNIYITMHTILYAQWLPTPEVSFTDPTGGVPDMRFMLLPSDTEDSGILNSSKLRVYFRISEYTELSDIEFVYGASEFNAVRNGVIYECDDDPEVYYFYLSDAILQMLENGANEVTIRGVVLGGEEKELTVRKIGLFQLH